MSVQSAYRANYDRIARDHIRYWRETGKNPFQEEGTVARNENATVELVKKYLPDEFSLLDAGCAMGDLLLRLPSGKEQILYGVDMSEDYVAVARSRGLENVQRGRIEKMPFIRNFFDMVVCTDVLELVLDLNAAVRELVAVLRPGGVIIARTPNEEALAYDTTPYEFVHLRRFDHPTFHLLFGKIFGLEVLEVVVAGDVIHAVARK